MANTYKYETTCFIDKDDNLSGKFNVSEGCYVDFDIEDVFVDNIPQKISSTDMRLLCELLKKMPNVVSYADLFILYYGENEYFGRDSEEKQILRNFQNRISKYIPIKAKTNEGYRIISNRKIKKFRDVSRDGIFDISTLFSTEKENSKEITKLSNDASESALAFSKRFFNSGARKLLNGSDFDFYEELEKFSKLYKNIVDFKMHYDFNNIFENSHFLLKDIYDCVIFGCEKDKNREILEIKGSLGSYKNRMMQYLYLMILKGNNNVLPFYINIASYEKIAENDINNTVDDFIKLFTSDISDVKNIIGNASDKIPLIMLDGIRDFSCGKESLYYSIKKSLNEINCKIIVCIDNDFTANRQHVFKVHPLAINNCMLEMNIKSMRLNNRQSSISFIKNCISLFDVSIKNSITAEIIYDNLVRLNFISIDAYWLVKMLKTMQANIIDAKTTISDIYAEICLNFLGGHKELDSASELAFDFEFGAIDLNVEQMYYDKRWRLIRKHRSVLDYLIARYYIRKISELDFVNKSHDEVKKSLAFFNMVLQKNITRFVVTMLNGVDDYEHKIMVIATKYYDDLSLFGKSELTFWMARLKNPKRRFECLKLLKKYTEIELERYNKNDFDSVVEKKDSAFLIRGSTVSLIYENDRDALNFYLSSLLSDKIANSVNRGFHLEYYGDKPYIPNSSLLDFDDDITKGENTLTVLCLSLDRRIKRKDVSSLVAPLEVMTICNLIQARIEQPTRQDVLDVSPYIDKCLKYISWIIPQKTLKGLVDVEMYFMWMHKELTELKQSSLNLSYKRFEHHDANAFNELNHAKEISRTGWVKSGVNRPENIVEHMYNCWLLAMLYLPDNYELEEYDKNKVLQMLLIHDLGETITGDINRPEKLERQRFYDNQENEAMYQIMLNGTYPNMANLNKYLNLWKEWSEEDTINYLVAKDIDNIQTIYQFCDYYTKESIFSDSDIMYWLSGIDRLNTDIGKSIADTIILTNPAYSAIVEIYNK